MPDTPLLRGLIVVLAAYAAGAAWYWLNIGLPPATGSPELTGGGLIAFLLPTTAAVVLWLFHTFESRRPLCSAEPGDCAATERIVFRIIVFIAGLHGLVLLLVTEVVWVRHWGLQLSFLLIGALLVSVGNLLPQTRPNVLVGIRTPRSLRSRQFWMEINRAGGYVSVALGLVMIVAAVGLDYRLVRQVTVAAMPVAVGILVGRYRTLVRASEQACDQQRASVHLRASALRCTVEPIARYPGLLGVEECRNPRVTQLKLERRRIRGQGSNLDCDRTVIRRAQTSKIESLIVYTCVLGL